MDGPRPPLPLRWTLSCALLILGLAACGGSGSTPPPQTGLGSPIPGLSPQELAAFERGRAVFSRRFKPSEGLGPFYNATSCASCHSTPVPGGSSQLYRNFYLARFGDPANPTGQFDLGRQISPIVPSYGQDVQHPSAVFSLTSRRHAIPPTGPGTQPRQAAQRNAIPIFGVGLFEFVTDDTIFALADPNDLDNDGISGRTNTDLGDLGRFGVKAQTHNVERFTRGPLQNQMGVTTNPLPQAAALHPLQVSQNPDVPTQDGDGVADPELALNDLSDLVIFARFLAPPEPKAATDITRRGQALFETMACTACHIPSLPSSRGPVNAYTDLLLHEMGPDLADDIAMGVPQASTIDGPTPHREFRTQPLWGVSLHAPFLHDGRAETLLEAILMHAGEAQAARDAFNAASAADQADVIAFLESL